MGEFVKLVCGECGHEQTISWGEGFFQLNRNNLADNIHEPEGLSHEVRLILQKEDAVIENLQMMGYYCPVCHTWDSFLNFSIISRHLVYTPRYQCKKCLGALRPVLYRNHAKKPWKCEKCGCSGPKTTLVGLWD